MRNLFLFIYLMLFYSVFGYSQNNFDNAPVHYVKEKPYYHTKFESKAYIDSIVWSDYLNWNLFLDSTKREQLPDSVFKIHVRFVIDEAGKLTSLKVYTNPHELGNTRSGKVNQIPT